MESLENPNAKSVSLGGGKEMNEMKLSALLLSVTLVLTYLGASREDFLQIIVGAIGVISFWAVYTYFSLKIKRLAKSINNGKTRWIYNFNLIVVIAMGIVSIINFYNVYFSASLMAPVANGPGIAMSHLLTLSFIILFLLVFCVWSVMQLIVTVNLVKNKCRLIGISVLVVMLCVAFVNWYMYISYISVTDVWAAA